MQFSVFARDHDASQTVNFSYDTVRFHTVIMAVNVVFMYRGAKIRPARNLTTPRGICIIEGI